MSTEARRVSPSSNYRKYQTRNPLVRALIERFLARVCERVGAWQPRRIVDLGCGEGIVARRLSSLPFRFEYLGLDVDPASVQLARAANPGLRFEAGDFLRREPEAEWADVVLCLEVLEHLDDPEAALHRLLAWTRGYALVSVPWEPWFRLGNLMRGKDLTRLGNHVEHVQQFGRRSLIRLLAGFTSQVRVEPCFPWLIGVVAKPPGRLAP